MKNSHQYPDWTTVESFGYDLQEEQADYNIPPYKITDEIMNQVVEIVELISEIEILNPDGMHPLLRKENRIKTIQASLAIENNTLTIEQVTDILDGKHVIGSEKEIKEVRNAFKAYDLLPDLDPYLEKDLKRAHGVLMGDLVEISGKYRNRSVGVTDGVNIIHMAPPSHIVPANMSNLFAWVRNSNVHPLVKSCVFHYEFEFIHPFLDGNGRMGRLWQTALLAKWKPIFAWIPIENIIRENQQNYYKVLLIADNRGESTIFIKFMLDCILKTLKTMILNGKLVINENKKKQNRFENALKIALKNALKTKDYEDDIYGIDHLFEIDKKLNKAFKKSMDILSIIKESPGASANDFSLKLQISLRYAMNLIKAMKDGNIIRRVGPDKGGHWEVFDIN
ncbi:MAG: Fic family protein [Bacteroidales bacterium]|nr:Fic family protein [Bacteroidales bacterium]